MNDTIEWSEATMGTGVFGMLIGYVDELVDIAEQRADRSMSTTEAQKSGAGAFINAGSTHATSKYNSVQYEGIFAMVFEAFVALFSSHVKCSIHLKNQGGAGVSSNLSMMINFPSVTAGFNAGGFSAASLASTVSRTYRPYTRPPSPPRFRLTYQGLNSIYLVKASSGVINNPKEFDTIDITGNKSDSDC